MIEIYGAIVVGIALIIMIIVLINVRIGVGVKEYILPYGAPFSIIEKDMPHGSMAIVTHGDRYYLAYRQRNGKLMLFKGVEI